MSKEYGYSGFIRLGAAGGLGNPAAVASAFAMGAAYVVTGSINQCSIEAEISQEAKAMLAKAGVSDVTMCPSADMFEMGVKVQVLKKGTMFPGRASQLYDLYVRYPSLEDIPQGVRDKLEKQVFRKPISEVWEETRAFFEAVAPSAIDRAEKDPKHKMALVFRWYLGQSSRWPIVGEKDRAIDYQIWCGAAMGAFNEWVKGTFLEPIENRSVVQIARNLLEGAAKVIRAHQFRSYGIPIPSDAFNFRPRSLE
jgi:PfaD family protein